MQLYEENENIQTDNQIDLWDLAETMWKNFCRSWMMQMTKNQIWISS